MSTKRYRLDYLAFFGFIATAILFTLIWRTYYGYYILYPFTILGTWFHEMGHGIMSILVGGSFNYLEIFPNGSGLAYSSYYSNDFYFNKNIALALVSASGLFGPPLIGAILILMSSREKTTKIMLYVLAVFMFLSVIIWVRTAVGIIVITLLSILIFITAKKGNDTFQQLIVQFLGVIACIDTYKQINYLYTESATINGETFLSDTGKMAEYLGKSHTFWATVILVLSFSILLYSLYVRHRNKVI